MTKIFNNKKDTKSREISLNHTNRTDKSDNYDNSKKESNNTSNNMMNLNTIVTNLKSNPPIIQKVVIDFNKRLKNLSIDSNSKIEKYLFI